MVAATHLGMGTLSVSRRTALQLLLSGTGVAVLTACGAIPQAGGGAPAAQPTSGGASVVSAPAPATPAVQPRSGGMLRAALPTEIPNVDPHGNSPNAYDTLWLAFDRLTAYDAKLQPQPMLAESWEVSSDYREVKLNLRKGVQWHSGREFTSDDVKYNFLRVRDPRLNAGALALQSAWWTTIDTPEKYTVVLKSAQPAPLVFDSFEFFNMADKDTLEGPDAKSKAVGTGPYLFAEWSPGDHIRLLKNKNYWQSGRPYLDEIELRITRDAQAMIAMIEAGAVDAVLTPSWRDFARLKADPKYQAITNPLTGRWYDIGWNVQSGPIADKRVRQALNYAIDRKRFAEMLMFGIVTPRSLPWLPNSPAYEASRENFYTFDLDKAKALLTQAGVQGLETEFLISNDYPELSDLAQIYQADLLKVGVKLNIKRIESAAFFDSINNRKYPGMYAITVSRAQLEPPNVLITSGMNPDVNNSGFKNDAYTQLVKSSATEPDLQKRKQLYTQINDLLLDEAFSLALSSAQPRMLAHAGVHGVGYSLHEGFDWTNVWIQ
jgi:peptide/nickel transport system substrate-binding protein